MINWHESMTQTFEFYTVDPLTWRNDKLINNVESCTITRDESVQTLGSATLDCADSLGECYFRVYLVAIQNGVQYKFPLGTFIIQTQSHGFDGKRKDLTTDAYTPLIELKESRPPVGYSILKNTEIMSLAANICQEHMRAPVVPAKSTETLYSDFVANLDDNWLTFVQDFIANAKFKMVLDELGRLLFEPIQDVASLQPVKVFNDDNSSILYADLTNEHDLYGIPNVVEVVYSTDAGYLYSRVENNDPNSPISTINRGREIVYRETSPQVVGEPTQDYIDAYATQLLRNMSCLEHKITFSHGYYPVRIGDAVVLNYTKAGLNNVTAKITAQTIKCETGCTVQSTAVYTTKLWR